MDRRIVLSMVVAVVAAGAGCSTGDNDDGLGSFWSLPCEDPAPAASPAEGCVGYIVSLRDGLDGPTEAARIGDQCAVSVEGAWSSGFSTLYVDETLLACLRCDPAVARIDLDCINYPL